MNDSALIRLENLRALGLAPVELAQRLGSTKQHWSNVLRGQTSFGERTARRIEEGLGLLRGSLDQAQSHEDVSQKGRAGKPQTILKSAQHNVSSSQRIPVAMPYTPDNLKSAILLMGSLLGVLDLRSKSIIGGLLKDLAEHPDDAQDIAEKASALASVQQPITENTELEKAYRGRKGVAQTEGAHR